MNRIHYLKPLRLLLPIFILIIFGFVFLVIAKACSIYRIAILIKQEAPIQFDSNTTCPTKKCNFKIEGSTLLTKTGKIVAQLNHNSITITDLELTRADNISSQEIFSEINSLTSIDLDDVRAQFVDTIDKILDGDEYEYIEITENKPELKSQFDHDKNSITSCTYSSYEEFGNLLIAKNHTKNYCYFKSASDGSCGHFINLHPLSPSLWFQISKFIVIFLIIISLYKYFNSKKQKSRNKKKIV